MSDGFRQNIKYIPLEKIDTSPRYQRVRTRGALEKQVKNIAENFKPSLFQTPDVIEGGVNGYDYTCVDGAGRIGALRLRGEHGTHCRVLPPEPIKRASQTFIRLNTDRKQVGPLDKFSGDIYDPETQAIKEILRESGLENVDPETGHESYPRLAGGVDTMRAIFKMSRGDDRLRRSLRLVIGWPNKKRRISGIMLQTAFLLVTGQTELEKKIAATLERVSFAEAHKSVLEENGKLKSKYWAPPLARYIAKKHNARKSEQRVDLDLIDKNQAEFLKHVSTR